MSLLPFKEEPAARKTYLVALLIFSFHMASHDCAMR
jgi:hypothetical protein